MGKLTQQLKNTIAVARERSEAAEQQVAMQVLEQQIRLARLKQEGLL